MALIAKPGSWLVRSWNLANLKGLVFNLCDILSGVIAAWIDHGKNKSSSNVFFLQFNFEFFRDIKIKMEILTVRPIGQTVHIKIEDQNLNFLILSQHSFRNELHAPFLPYFDTQHLICKKNLIMFIGGSRGSQNCHKKMNDI